MHTIPCGNVDFEWETRTLNANTGFLECFCSGVIRQVGGGYGAFAHAFSGATLIKA